VNLNKGKFEALPVVRPDQQSVLHFHEATHPMFEQIKALQVKNANLRRTRDLLLPRLVGGEIGINE
jgi:type I restriction enzyme, S subunit